MSNTDPGGTFGAGVEVSEQTDIGLGYGAGQTGSAGCGVFGSSLSDVNAGAFASWGGFCRRRGGQF